MTDDRRQRTDDGGQMTDDGGQMTEDRSQTRRRPIGRDYAAAKDAEVGIGKWEGGKKRRWEGEMVRR
jgi:hypothetical protein